MTQIVTCFNLDDVAAVEFKGSGPGQTYFHVILNHGGVINVYPDWIIYSSVAAAFRLGYKYPNDSSDPTKGHGTYFISYSEIAVIEYTHTPGYSADLTITLKCGKKIVVSEHPHTKKFFDNYCKAYSIKRD